MSLQYFNQSLTLTGKVSDFNPDPEDPSFTIELRTGDTVKVCVGTETYYSVITNLDGLDRDRVPEPDDAPNGNPVLHNLYKYVASPRPVTVLGVHQTHAQEERFEGRNVYLLHSSPDRFMFEETHWWPAQATQMADRILDHLFDAKRRYSVDDFSEFYRTNLNILGQPTDETTQECAVLSRLLYDLASAYMMTGAERYLMAATAAADYQRDAFRSLSHDGRYCFWAYGRRRPLQGERGEFLLFASQGPDDVGTIALYEQIYALAGLTQFYRITLDWEVLEDIRRTINTFQDFFWDPPSATEKGFAGKGGYYSHLDPATMRPDTVKAPENRSKKNWNSVGDHIPAYLVNLILALEPLPQGEIRQSVAPLLDVCHDILEETSALICEKFPDPDSKFVFERFHADWTPDLTYRWQQNRAVVGHNLKIAWNLTRCAFHFQLHAKRLLEQGKPEGAEDSTRRADQCLGLAKQLAERMGDVGVDKVRGGIYDCVERNPRSGMPTEFAWDSTKDFWQQEQGILAYLILYGATRDQKHLRLARESSAFWNLFFLDRERQGYFFRTTADGAPILRGQYGMKSSHAIGYHAFELAYLAHMYTRAYVAGGIGDGNGNTGPDNSFCLYFKISSTKQQKSINVLPDFMPPGSVRIVRVRANGVDVTNELDPANVSEYQIPTDAMPADPVNGTVELVVEFQAYPAQRRLTDHQQSK